MGSEMCIRDRTYPDRVLVGVRVGDIGADRFVMHYRVVSTRHNRCLLYTSDAADERSSVDLGGRRIIKKKTNVSRYDYAHDKTTGTLKRYMHKTSEK